jgi:glutamate-5-semialdehyde dehydrogenase
MGAYKLAAVSTAEGYVREAATAAAEAAPGLAASGDAQLDEALRGMAERLQALAGDLIEVNRADVAAAESSVSPAVLDRLRLDEARLAAIAGQVRTLAELPVAETVASRTEIQDGLLLEERHIPIGVIGANYEARVNVTIDIASQMIKSRNACVLRTGAAVLGSATAIADRVIAPSLEQAGLPAGAVQLVRTPDRDAAHALVSQPDLVPLVILRGSGETTAELARTAAQHGVRTLAHAEGGGVLYVDAEADQALAMQLIERSLDRLGVCNRLNLLLVHENLWEEFVPRAGDLLERLGIAASLPPHDHEVGHEWATDAERSDRVTLAPVSGPRAAAELANTETSGLAAAIVTAAAPAAEEFFAAYRGTGVFWNATTRLLDGFELLAAPETGINIDNVPGPRGPVTYRDLFLRQYAVTDPSA